MHWCVEIGVEVFLNIAVIFAGGVGQRMGHSEKPKQFLELYGKPVIVYTLEHFERCNKIDGIVISCLADWIPYCQTLIKKFGLKKVIKIVNGGSTGQDSIFNGLCVVKEKYCDDTVVLIHDGVRPLINEETITDAIDSVMLHGSCIVTAPQQETIAIMNSAMEIERIVDRSSCLIAKAPQCFFLKDIYAAHMKAKSENRHDFIDSACLMNHYGYKLHSIEGPSSNIKITTPVDFYIFKAIQDLGNDNKEDS